ncbi:SARP family transcriptional regulator [Acrocarpospora phusangensis]|uniref:SARP family transcriptional regulator n=1 Tax=Acrocarpospora phusangensis TaxID=1070424 RepID=A0A919QHB9_9ACTN|nr:SARP family transcriptional regulator [Acrocarpospora phusangensis]
MVAGGEVTTIGGARLRALLVRLALDAGRVVTLDQLAHALWGDAAPADRANALQSLVSRLRRALPAAEPLRSAPGGYRLDVPKDDVDLHRFERLAAEGRRGLAEGDPATALALLDDALGLWRGRPLADLAEAPFADAAISRLDEAWLSATEDRIEACLALGSSAEPALGSTAGSSWAAGPAPGSPAGIAGLAGVAGLTPSSPVGLAAEVAELAAEHPLRERLRGLLMRALCAEGRQAEALAGYEEFRRRLADELGVDPGPALQQTYLTVLRGPATPVRRSRGNLRTPLTSFVGRDDEIAWIGARLRRDRLVTLVGPGGAGKTRLAVTVAAGLPQATWLVELAPVTDPADVLQAVLGTLGPAFNGDPGSMARLVETLSGAETLLLLDNCEHLVDAVARLADELLGQCPRLRVLATSREPLGIVGETLYPVPPLRLPDADELGPAVRLFADRAAAVSPGFALTAANTGHVIEICRRLDGLPLAIELAAARLRSLTVEQVASRLDDRFRLLTGGSRTAMARHQTLRAVVAWSWDLLTGGERRLVERLAVFPAGFTPAAAEPLGGTLDLLAALVDKSLLQLVEGPEGPRYRMLETIREYALERLAESGDLAETRAAHAAYFLELAETAEPYLRGRDQMSWIAVLDVEHANLLAALHHAADRGDADTAVRLGAALSQFWMIRGRRSEAAGWLRLALDVPGESPATARQIATALYLINSAVNANFAKLARTIEELREIALSDLDVDNPMLALMEPALALFTDDAARGLEVIAERLGHPDPWVRATLHMLRAFIRENDGDRAGMHLDLTVAVSGYREIGERWGLAHALTSLADILLVSGDFDGAVEALEESIALIREISPDDDAGHQRIWLATVRAQKGDVDRARAELQEMAVWDDGDWTVRNVVFARLGLGDLSRWLGDLDEAALQYGLAVAEVTAIKDTQLLAPQFRALVLTSRAFLALEAGDTETAADFVDQAAGLTLLAKDMPVLAKVGVAAAAVQAERGDPVRGAVTMGATEQLRGAPDRFNAEVVRVSGRLATILGETAYARAYGTGAALTRPDAIAQVRDASRPATVGAYGEGRENGQHQH